MPGVLIIEALAQAAALLSFATMGKGTDETGIYFFAGIDRARFKRPVEPGDQLRLEADAGRALRNVMRFDTRAVVDGRVVAEAQLMCAYRKLPVPGGAVPGPEPE
jgi:3-hydroxyacyl-[acyl-carrier-protein] dehydratase